MSIHGYLKILSMSRLKKQLTLQRLINILLQTLMAHVFARYVDIFRRPRETAKFTLSADTDQTWSFNVPNAQNFWETSLLTGPIFGDITRIINNLSLDLTKQHCFSCTSGLISVNVDNQYLQWLKYKFSVGQVSFFAHILLFSSKCRQYVLIIVI